jgi:hypothetical protein
MPLSTQPPSTSRQASQSISPAASKAGERESGRKTQWYGVVLHACTQLFIFHITFQVHINVEKGIRMHAMTPMIHNEYVHIIVILIHTCMYTH